MIEAGKRTFYEQIEQSLETAYATASDTMTRNLCSTMRRKESALFWASASPAWKGA